MSLDAPMTDPTREARLAHIRDAFEACRREHALESIHLDRAITVGVAFADRCSPSDASRGELHIVAHFLYAIVGLNELQRSERSAYHSAVEGFFQSYQGHPATDVWSTLGLRLRAWLVQRYPDTCRASFTHALWETLGASLWELETSPLGPPTELGYALLRERTIGVQPFLELWKILRGLSAAKLLSLAAPLAHIEWLSRKVQFLENDLGSLARDQKSGQPNAVTVYAVHHSLPQQAATEAMVRLKEESHATLLRLLNELERSSACNEEGRRYACLVRRCTNGNAEAMADLPIHYGTQCRTARLASPP